MKRIALLFSAVLLLCTAADATTIDFSTYPDGIVPQVWTPDEAPYAEISWPNEVYYCLGSPSIYGGYLLIPDDQGFGLTIYFDVMVTDISVSFYAQPDVSEDPITVHLNDVELVVGYFDSPYQTIESDTETDYLSFYYEAMWCGNEMEKIASISFTPVAEVPEPATLLFLSAGVACIACKKNYRGLKIRIYSSIVGFWRINIQRLNSVKYFSCLP